MGALQAVVAYDTNVAFAKKNLFFVVISKVSQNFVHVQSFTNFGFNGQKRHAIKAVLLDLRSQKMF